MKQKLLPLLELAPSIRLPNNMEVCRDDENEDSKCLQEDETMEDDEEDVGGGKEGMMEKCCGVGRVWIFLVLGILTLVFSAVQTGIYLNMRTMTSSIDNVEVMPTYIPAAAAGLAGLLVLLLFWKRYKVLVYGGLTMCAAATVLCVVTAVLTGTHVLQPLTSVTECEYNRLEKVCRCVTQFRRVGLQLEKVVKGDDAYLIMRGTLNCDDVRQVIPGLLFTTIGIYAVVSLVCTVAAVIAALVYRTEQNRKSLEDLQYENHGHPLHPESSDNHTEHQSAVSTQPAPTTTLTNIYTNPNTTINDEDISTNDEGECNTGNGNIFSSTDASTDASHMRRCQSFNQLRRGPLREGSPISSTSSQAASFTGREKNMGGVGEGQSKLKAHRKKGRRAVTLHGLDREQLLLILSLQMRYLQESEQSAMRSNYTNSRQNDTLGDSLKGNSALLAQLHRRAKTPTPRQEYLLSSGAADDDLDYRPAKLVRSHTPQPHHFKIMNEHNPGLYQPHLYPHQPQPPAANTNIYPHQPPAANNNIYPHQPPAANNNNLYPHQPPAANNNNLYPHQPPAANNNNIYPHQPPAANNNNIYPHQPPAANNNDIETPTIITYDLRNIKAGQQIIHDNTPSDKGSNSYNSSEDSHSSNNSSLTCPFNGPKLTPDISQTCSQTQHSSDLTDKIRINMVAANSQQFGNPKCRFSQYSQISTSSQSETENSLSDTMKSISSQDKLIMSSQDKLMMSSQEKLMMSSQDKLISSEDEKVKTGMRNLLKKERHVPKDFGTESGLLANVKSAKLCRSDSNSSKGKVVADRWQTLMEDGSTKQAQTLWENVLRKTESDPHTPDTILNSDHPLYPHIRDSTLDQGCSSHLSESTLNLNRLSNPHTPDSTLERDPLLLSSLFPEPIATKNVGCDTAPTTKYNHCAINNTSELSQHPISSHATCREQLNNSNGHSTWTQIVSQNLSQNLPTHLQPHPNRHYESSNMVPNCEYYTNPQNTFVPIGNSSMDFSEDNSTEKVNFSPVSDNLARNLRESMISPNPFTPYRKRGDVYDNSPEILPDQEIKQKKYRNAYDREMINRESNKVNRTINSSQTVARGHEMGNRGVYKSQIEGLSKHANSRKVSSRPGEDDTNSQIRNKNAFSQSRRKSNSVVSDSNPLQTYPNIYRLPDDQGQFQRDKQSQNLEHSAHIRHPQQSAFYTLDHIHKSGPYIHYDSTPAKHGSCDTDLDSLPNPHYQTTQNTRNQFIPRAPMYHSLESVTRPLSSRSGSTSSSEHSNSFYTSAELPTTPAKSFLGGFPDFRNGARNWSENQARFASSHLSHLPSNGVYTQQPPPQQQQMQPHYDPWQQPRYRKMSTEQLYPNRGQVRHPYMNIRRCQSVEDEYTTRRPFNTSRHRNTLSRLDKPGEFYQNLNALRAEKTNGVSRNGGAVGQLMFQSFPNYSGQNGRMPTDPEFLLKNRDIAGYVGVVKLVESTDSGGFVETVI